MKTRLLLYILMCILGLGAIAGGLSLIISPSGELMKIPLYLLEKSPFNNFLIPGIILFVVLGIFPIALVFALVKKPESKFAEAFNFFKDMYWAWSYSIYIAFALIIWIQLQMVFIQAISGLHTIYMFFAIVIIFVALQPSIRSYYKIK